MNINEINPSQQNLEKKPDYSPKWAVLLGNAYYLQKQEMTVKYANNPADLFEHFKNIKQSKELFSATNITPVLEHTKEVVVHVGVGRKASQDKHVVALVKEGDRLQHDAIYAQNAGDLERVSKEARRVFVDTVVNASKGNGSRYEGKLVEVDGVYIPENEAFKLQKNENPDEKYAVGSIIKTFDSRSKDEPINVSTSSITGDVELSLVPKEGEVHTTSEPKKFGEPWTDEDRKKYHDAIVETYDPHHDAIWRSNQIEEDTETPAHGDGAVPPIPPKPPRGGDDGKSDSPEDGKGGGKDLPRRIEPVFNDTEKPKTLKTLEDVDSSLVNRQKASYDRLKNLGLNLKKAFGVGVKGVDIGLRGVEGVFNISNAFHKHFYSKKLQEKLKLSPEMQQLAFSATLAMVGTAIGGPFSFVPLALSSFTSGARVHALLGGSDPNIDDARRRRRVALALFTGIASTAAMSAVFKEVLQLITDASHAVGNFADQFTGHHGSPATQASHSTPSPQVSAPSSIPPSGVDVTPSTPSVPDAPSASVTTPPSVPDQLQTAVSTPPASTVVAAPEVAPPVDLMAEALNQRDRILRAGLDAHRIARGGN